MVKGDFRIRHSAFSIQAIRLEDARLDSWDGPQLLEAFQAAARWLEQHAESVNALNVFPVPDGDTGTNMVLTLNGALQEVAPDPSCAVVADKIRYWATMRGRGNSGIILSQVLRGMAQGLAGHARMDAPALAAALAQASATAYKAVMQPVEGTMLTVIREASAAAQEATAGGADLVHVLEAAVHAARVAVQRTPELLKILRQAGVVDAGGQGLFLILEGMLRYARQESVVLPAASAHPPTAMAFKDVHGPGDFGYCTNFVLHGRGMPYEEIRATLAGMGQSAVIVGDGELIKVHLHLVRPGDALNYAVSFGALSQIEITNMDLQREALHQAPPSLHDRQAEAEPIARVGVVAVAPGPGFATIFHSLNVEAVVDGGPTMNPSTADLLAAIERLPQPEVIVLPNNRNVVLAARQAAQLSTKRVEVLPAKTVAQGIAARLRFNYQADLQANLHAMTSALLQVRTAEVTRAARDASIEGINVRAGQTIGLLDGELVTVGEERERVIDALLDRMRLADYEIVTIYYGRSIERTEAEALAAHIHERWANVEIEVQDGGQPLYDYIISAE